jgi:hypothetical protein
MVEATAVADSKIDYLYKSRIRISALAMRGTSRMAFL